MRSIWMLCLVMIAAMASAELVTVTQITDGMAKSTPGARNSALENVVLNLFETLRGIIHNGSGDIPVLDPLEVDKVSIDDDIIPFPGARVDLEGLTVNNLGTFIIDNINIRLTSIIRQRYSVEIEGHIPVLEGEADHYDLDVSALGYNVFGAGNIKLKVTNPRLKVRLQVRVRLSGLSLYLEPEQTTVQFNLDKFEPQITGLFHDEDANDFINNFLEDIVPTLLDKYEPEITKFLSDNAHEGLKSILADLDLGGIIGY